MKLVYRFLFVLTMTLGALPAAEACRGSRCSYLEWYGGNCGEFTPRGDLIRWAANSECRRSIGTFYDWYGGNCGEFTPRGDLVQWMPISACQRECGVVRRR